MKFRKILHLVMSRPLQLCTLEKLHVFRVDGRHISNERICEVINDGIDYAIMRWTYSRLSCDKYMTNCCVKKVLWTMVH